MKRNILEERKTKSEVGKPRQSFFFREQGWEPVLFHLLSNMAPSAMDSCIGVLLLKPWNILLSTFPFILDLCGWHYLSL